MKITSLSIKRPTVVVVVMALLVGLGLFTYGSLIYELLPKITSPVLSVSTVYPGASPGEVENSVTKKLEDALSSLEGVKKMSSTSMESFSLITVELVHEADVDLALQDAQRKVNAILGDLPDEVDPPSLGKFDISAMPIMNLGVTAQVAPTELYDLVENKVQPALAKIPGIAQVKIQGGQEREILVNVDADRLMAFGLNMNDVRNAVHSANMDFPTGKVKRADGQTLIRLSGKYTSVEQLSELVVKHRTDGSVVRLNEMATGTDGEKEPEGISRVNGADAIGLTIQKQTDANAVSLSEEVRKEIAALEQENAKAGLGFSIPTDTSVFTLEAADHVIFDLILAIVLVALVMLLFLHSIRNAVIVMLAVPAALIATFSVMYLMGFSLNLMSLLGLSLVVGILVDDAIVVVENIHRHLEMGKSAAQAAYDGIREIGLTVVSITLVIVAVFLPIAMTSGMISDLLLQFSVVVATSTLLSLFIAFTMVPLLSSRFGKVEHFTDQTLVGRFVLGFERVITSVEQWLTGLLQWSFGHKRWLFGITLALLVGSFALVGAGFIGSEFVAAGDRGQFYVRVELPKNATLEQTDRMTKQVERYLFEDPMVTSVATTVGQTSGRMSTTSTPYMAEVNVSLVPAEKRSKSTALFARETKIALEEKFVGAKFSTVPVNIMGSADEAPIDVMVQGPDLEQVMAAAPLVMDAVRKIEGTAELKTSVEGGNPEINVQVDRTKMAKLGLTMDKVGANMRTAFSGDRDSKFRDGDNEYDIAVQLDGFDRRSSADVGALTLINDQGQPVQLGQFATITESTGPSKLERIDKVPSLSVQAQVLGRPVGTVGAEVQAALAHLDLPPGVTVKMGGQMERQGDAFGSLGIALLASLILVYLIMVVLYDNYVHPLVVMFSLPLALIGAFVALALVNQSLSIFSILGLIMLIGLVAKNAILVVDFTNQMIAAGLEVKDALMQAVHTRFRPILMTTLAMVFGMLPIALATGAGAEWKNGLAWVLIGGLTSSMFLTLLVVPVIYYLFDRVMARFGWNKKTEIVLNDDELHNSEVMEALRKSATMPSSMTKAHAHGPGAAIPAVA
ncbi:MAG TPA: efflux RND transporter permease subunit [Flavobacteriales bacterium]|nr:efflux RND transporter permease subunit [Flavobacteriales bacterium]